MDISTVLNQSSLAQHVYSNYEKDFGRKQPKSFRNCYDG